MCSCSLVYASTNCRYVCVCVMCIIQQHVHTLVGIWFFNVHLLCIFFPLLLLLLPGRSGFHMKMVDSIPYLDVHCVWISLCDSNYCCNIWLKYFLIFMLHLKKIFLQIFVWIKVILVLISPLMLLVIHWIVRCQETIVCTHQLQMDWLHFAWKLYLHITFWVYFHFFFIDT